MEARVSGSGTGIPKRVRAKLFQPCFPAKPMGEGTALGLSLSHDSSARGSGGTLTAASREDAGTEFIGRLLGAERPPGGLGFPLTHRR